MTSRSNKDENYCSLIIKAIGLRYEAEFKPDTVQQWIKELSSFSKEELDIAFQRFKSEYESLPFRFSVSAGLIKQMKPVFTIYTIEERLYMSLKDKNPYAFLKKINPKLAELADSSGLFDRSISTVDQGFRVKDVAKRFLESEINRQRGFEQLEPDKGLKQLEFKKDEINRTQNPLKGLSISEAAAKALEIMKTADKTK